MLLGCVYIYFELVPHTLDNETGSLPWLWERAITVVVVSAQDLGSHQGGSFQ